MEIRSDACAAFLRFRERGDVTALAEVFDLVAQSLLLIASHIASRGQQPEDLLQETFLAALQKADRYDAAQPLEPWLVGILVNVTRSDRRRRAKETPGIEVDIASSHDASSHDDPVRGAADAEFARCLGEALRALPVPQREVMTLHLVHGMTPTEIAHATSRPVGTVKSWIHRCREEVRRRLPVGLLVPFGNLLRGMTELASVRAAVLRAGTSGPILATETTATGIAARQVPRMLAVVGGLLAATLAMAVFVGERPPVPATPVEVPAAVTTAAPAPDGQPRMAAEPVVRSPATVMVPANTCELTIVGEIEGEPFSWSGSLLAGGGSDPQLRTVPFTTDVSGHCVLTGVPFGRHAILSDRAASVVVVVDRPRQQVSVAIPRGIDVHGSVVDRDDRPVGGASVWMAPPHTLDERLLVARTGGNGAFTVRDAPAGSCLTVTKPGSRASTFVVVNDDATTSRAIEVRLDESAVWVAFEVVNDSGRPVAGATLQLGDCLGASAGKPHGRLRRYRNAWIGRSDDRGVAICDEAPPRETLALHVRAPDHVATTLRVTTQGIDGRMAPIRVVLDKGGVVTGRVTGDGKPMFALVMVQPSSVIDDQGPSWRLPMCRTDGNGVYRLTGVPLGSVPIRAAALDGRFREQGVQVLPGSPVDWSPSLESRFAVRGRVVSSRGEPLVDLCVTSRAVGAEPVVTSTDANGMFELRDLVARPEELVVTPGAANSVILGCCSEIGSGDHVEVTIDAARIPTARMRGRLVGIDSSMVGLVSAIAGFCPGRAGTDGSFELGPVPPGPYRFLVGDVQNGVAVQRAVTLVANSDFDLGDVLPGDRASLGVAMERVVDHAATGLLVQTEDDAAVVAHALLRDGRAQIDLPVGTYRLCAIEDGTFVAHRVVSVPGEGLALQLDRTRGEPVLLAARPSAPCVDFRVVWEIEGPAGPHRYKTARSASLAANGCAELSVVLPPGEHVVRVTSAAGATAVRAVRLPLPPGGTLEPIVVQ